MCAPVMNPTNSGLIICEMMCSFLANLTIALLCLVQLRFVSAAIYVMYCAYVFFAARETVD